MDALYLSRRQTAGVAEATLRFIDDERTVQTREDGVLNSSVFPLGTAEFISVSFVYVRRPLWETFYYIMKNKARKKNTTNIGFNLNNNKKESWNGGGGR